MGSEAVGVGNELIITILDESGQGKTKLSKKRAQLSLKLQLIIFQTFANQLFANSYQTKQAQPFLSDSNKFIMLQSFPLSHLANKKIFAIIVDSCSLRCLKNIKLTGLDSINKS